MVMVDVSGRPSLVGMEKIHLSIGEAYAALGFGRKQLRVVHYSDKIALEDSVWLFGSGSPRRGTTNLLRVSAS
jgi:hypothetical protein